MYFKIHHLTGHIQELYLAEYPDGILMLDGGSRADATLVEDYITNKLNRPMSDLRMIMVSHMHPDHAGAAQILRRKFNIPIASFYTVNAWYSGLRGRLQHLFDIFMGWFVVIRKKLPRYRFWFPPKLYPDFPLHNADAIPSFPDWKIYHTPGHTSHDIVIHNSEASIIYAGDLVINMHGKFILPFPINLPKCMVKSIEVLEKLEWKEILLAHGGPATRQQFTPEVMIKLKALVHRKLRMPFVFLQYFTHLPKPIKQYKHTCD